MPLNQRALKSVLSGLPILALKPFAESTAPTRREKK